MEGGIFSQTPVGRWEFLEISYMNSFEEGLIVKL